MLSEHTDAVGNRRAKLVWRMSEPEKRTAAEAVATFARNFGMSSLGRLRALADTPDQVGPKGSLFELWHHHMGTTRMHSSEKQGVVDPDCKVHGVNNLFLAGSSVFTTSGVANPTFTLVAMAIRLADRLKTEFRKRPA